MHVNIKRIATAGLLVAFTILMLVLSSVIESNSMFFIAASSFCVGISLREWGVKTGLAFLFASILLGLLVVPNKWHCLTFAGMGVYLWLGEVLWDKVASAKGLKHRTAVLWCGRYLIFNLLYLPVLFGMPQLIFTGKVNGLAAVVFFIVGQAVLLIYEKAHQYFQIFIWGKLRTKIMGNEYE